MRVFAALATVLVASIQADAQGTPLHEAARQGDADAITVLINAGADPNVKDAQDGGIPLHEAALRGHTEAIAALLDAGADTNAKNENGLTPLHGATIMGHAEAIAALLDAGADTNAKNENGLTPLHLWAFFIGTTEIIAILIEAGADPNAKNDSRSTPLHVAVSGGRTEAIALLLDAGADPNAKDDSRSTPLHVAVSGGRTEAIALLLDAGADTNTKDENGLTPLDLAMSKGHAKARDILIAHEPTRQPSPELLLTAIQNGDMIRVIALLDAGVDPNAKDDSRSTPLHVAVSTTGPTQGPIITRLLDAGADTNTKNENGLTPLDLALSEGHAKARDILIAHGLTRRPNPALLTAVKDGDTKHIVALLHAGTDPNTKDAGGYTSLHWAIGNGQTGAITGYTEAITLLLDAGAHPNLGIRPVPKALTWDDVWDDVIRGSEPYNSSLGKTPLHWASSSWASSPEAVTLLLDAGADPNATDDSGDTPLHEAASGKGRVRPKTVTAVITLLLDAGADPNAKRKSESRFNPGFTPLHEAANTAVSPEEDTTLLQEVITLLLDAGADPNAKDRGESIPLHWARSPEAVTLLLDAGADLDAKNKSGNTPLHEAVFGSHHRETIAAIITLLLDAGADPNAKNAEGATPLHNATRLGHPLTALLDAGADLNLNAKDVGGHTPLHWAASLGQTEAIALLLAAGADPNARSNEGETPLGTALRTALLGSEFDLPKYRKAIDTLTAGGARM